MCLLLFVYKHRPRIKILQVGMFLTFVVAEHKKQLEVASNATAAAASNGSDNGEALQCLQALVTDNGMSIARFHPLSNGGTLASDKPWLWLVRFSCMSENGPALHRRCIATGDRLLTAISATIKADVCPNRRLDKRIAKGRKEKA